MPSGIFGQAALVANTNTTIYTVPANTVATATVNFCNRGATISRIRLAISATDTPSAAEWIEYDADLLSSSIIERSGLVLSAGKKLVAYSEFDNVSVSAFGFEE
jgi:hypothetical protein